MPSVRALCWLISFLLAAGLAGCAARSSETFAYKRYPGPLRPASELAIVRLGDAQAVEIDGRTVLHADWTEVHLLPGTHDIRWQTEFGVSVTIEPSGFATGVKETRVELAAGQVYVLRSDRTTGPGYRMYFWIEEAVGGRVVAGKPKP
jgi:hypothetical protein